MLTADLVHARRRGAELRLVALTPDTRARAEELGGALLAVANAHVGSSREELTLAMGAIDAAAKERKLRDGLTKLVLDRCVFDADEGLDAEAIRREVFSRSSSQRAALEPGHRLAREQILSEVAHAMSESVERVEHGLFSDLRGAHVLRGFEPTTAKHLLLEYEHAQAQAVLLRAVKVTVDVFDSSPLAVRALFRKLKFLRLLHAISPIEGGHRIVVDGPFSVFGPVTKYGLQLALLVPALEACDAWKLEADVRWGTARTPLVFRLEGQQSRREGAQDVPLSDDVAVLLETFRSRKSAWKATPATTLLDLPGVGLSVPDLVFERATGERVYLEVMGYWSRDAVWKRIELVRAGLQDRILFAVSSRLRVSEEVLGDELPSALYVYKGAMSARAIEERLERLVER